MIKRQRMIRLLRRGCFAAMLMIAGAQLLAWYLAHVDPQFDHPLRDMRSALNFSFLVLLVLHSYLVPSRKPSGNAYRKPTGPDGSGVLVVAATGCAAAYYFLWDRDIGGGYPAAAAILFMTLVAAALLWRFTVRHAGEIGEARFATNRDE